MFIFLVTVSLLLILMELGSILVYINFSVVNNVLTKKNKRSELHPSVNRHRLEVKIILQLSEIFSFYGSGLKQAVMLFTSLSF